MSAADVEFRYAVLCDDVRREDNGKLFVIGMYGGDIRVTAKPPAQIPVTVLCFVHANVAPTEAKIDIEFLIDDKLTLKGTRTIKIETAGLAFFAFSKAPIQIRKSGILSIVVIMPSGERHLGWSGPLTVIDPSPASTSETPPPS